MGRIDLSRPSPLDLTRERKSRKKFDRNSHRMKDLENRVPPPRLYDAKLLSEVVSKMRADKMGPK